MRPQRRVINWCCAEGDRARVARDGIRGVGPAGRCILFPCLVVAALSGSSFGPPARAESPADPTSSRAAREEAARAVPWQQLNPEQRRLTQSIISNAAIYRRLPTRVIDCDPEMFTFLLQHPEVIADVWRVMGISRVQLEKLSDGSYRGSDGAGTTGVVRFLSSNCRPDAQNTAVIFADGSYDGKPFVLPIKAQTIALLRSDAVQESNGRRYVTVRADVFIRVEQMAVELVARTVQPWVNATADRNLIETLTFFSNFSHTAERNPEGMQRLAARLTTIDEPTRRALVQLCYQTAGRYSYLERPGRAGEALLVQSDGVANALVK